MTSSVGNGKEKTMRAGIQRERAAMLCFGVWRGEAVTVLSKAIKLCLECVGIG